MVKVEEQKGEMQPWLCESRERWVGGCAALCCFAGERKSGSAGVIPGCAPHGHSVILAAAAELQPDAGVSFVENLVLWGKRFHLPEEAEGVGWGFLYGRTGS